VRADAVEPRLSFGSDHLSATKKKSRDPGSERYLQGWWRLFVLLHDVTANTAGHALHLLSRPDTLSRATNAM